MVQSNGVSTVYYSRRTSLTRTFVLIRTQNHHRRVTINVGSARGPCFYRYKPSKNFSLFDVVLNCTTVLLLYCLRGILA